MSQSLLALPAQGAFDMMPGASGANVYYSPSPSPVSSQQPKVRQVWTPEEDRLLREAVAKETPKYGPISWHKVAAHLPGRNNKDCRKRWHYSIASTIRKGTWTREEDEKLREAVEQYGARWSKIAEAVGTRNGDQCWKRWYDCLDPRIDKSPWTPEDDAKLLHLVSIHGRNWSEIVHKHFPNRTSLAAKNRYSILRRRHESQTNPSPKPSRSSSLRHSSRSRPTTTTSPPSPAPTALGGSSSPYLHVPSASTSVGTPSPLSTPEPPEFLTTAGSVAADMATQEPWMTALDIDDLLNAGSSSNGGSLVVDGWSPSPAATEAMSATPSPYMGQHHEFDFQEAEFGGAGSGGPAAADSWTTAPVQSIQKGHFGSSSGANYNLVGGAAGSSDPLQASFQEYDYHSSQSQEHVMDEYYAYSHQVPRLDVHDVSASGMMGGCQGVPVWQTDRPVGGW